MSLEFKSLEEVLFKTASAIRPPERLTVSEAAAKYRLLNNPGSYVGPWKNEKTPYLVEVMDTLQSVDHTGLILVGPARCGKSDIFFNWCEYSALCDPADMLLVHMKQGSARDWSIGDFRKFVRANPKFAQTLAGGRHSTNVHDIHFLSGMSLLVKWPSITELSAKTLPRVWFMDYDRMPSDIDQEGPAFDLGRKRTQTYGRYGMTVAESSPGHEVDDSKWRASTPHEAPPTKGVLSLYNRGDRRRYYWRCAKCKEAFEPDFKLIVYPDSEDHMEAAEQATLNCPHCDFAHTFKPIGNQPGRDGLNLGGKWLGDGQMLMPNGEIIGTPVRSNIASFWLKGPCAAFTTWRDLVFNYLQAIQEYERTGDSGPLKTTVNVDQGLPFRPLALGNDLLPETLEDRSEEVEKGVVREGVRFIIAAVDIQKNHFVVQMMGYREDGDIDVIDRFSIRHSRRRDPEDETQFLWVSPAAYPEDWELLVEQVIEKTYPLNDDSGRHMGVYAVASDSGGREGVTGNAYAFWRWLRDEHPRSHHKRFQLVKGAAYADAPRVRITYPDSDKKDRKAGARGEVPVMQINSNTLKDMAFAMLIRDEAGGGRINFPNWLPHWFYSELTAEIRTAKGWQNPKKLRNEAFDLTCYCHALALHSRYGNIENIDWNDPPNYAADWDNNPFVFDSGDQVNAYDEARPSSTLADLGEALS